MYIRAHMHTHLHICIQGQHAHGHIYNKAVYIVTLCIHIHKSTCHRYTVYMQSQSTYSYAISVHSQTHIGLEHAVAPTARTAELSGG